MTTLSQARTALATTLATISGLRVHTTAPDDISPPAAVVVPAPGTFIDFDSTFSSSDELAFVILLIVSKASDRAGQETLDSLLARSGTMSVRAAIDADPDLGNTVEFANVSLARNYGMTEWAGVQYFSAELVVTVGVA